MSVNEGPLRRSVKQVIAGDALLAKFCLHLRPTLNGNYGWERYQCAGFNKKAGLA